MQTTNITTPISEKTVVEKKAILSGIITGQISGLIMAVVVMLVFSFFLNKNPLYPVQVIGSTVFGETALQNFHLGAIFVGLILHQFGPSLLWGVIFSFLAKKLSIQSIKEALGLGLMVGVLSMAGPYILIPFIMKTLHGVDFWNREVPIFWDWAAHIVFGASFALYPIIQNQFYGRSKQ